MPYINPERRRQINVGGKPVTTGELNYAITRAIIQFVEGQMIVHGGLRYITINDVRGAVEGAKLEFERRVAFPYEDKAIAKNGDVYPAEMV